MATTSTLYSPAELSYTKVALTASSSPFDGEPVLRADGRTLLSYRDIHLSTDVSSAQGALGSACVRLGGEETGAAGGSECWAGIRGEVVDVSAEDGFRDQGQVVVTVECAPSALPHLQPDVLQHLSTLLSSLFSARALPPSLLAQLVVLPTAKAWRLYLDVLILSASGGNVLDLAIMAARSALATTRIPLTRAVGYEPEGESDAMEQDQGISSLVKGGKAGKDAVDFELVDGDADGGSRLAGWQDLPVGLTINMIDQVPHLDGTVLEETAAQTQLVMCFTANGHVCGLQQLGAGEIESARLVPLIKEAQKISRDLMQALNAQLMTNV